MKLKTLVLATAIFSTGAFAASWDTLLIQGTVALVNEIKVNPEAKAIDLDILLGEVGTKIAVVDETSNNLDGYTIQMSSANDGVLWNTEDNSKSTPYELSYDGAAYAAPTSVAATVKTVASLTGLTTNNSDLLINLTAFPTAPAGVYTDTLTFSIVAN